MGNLRITLTTAVIALLLATSFLAVTVTIPEAVSAYTIRGPILISGDADFTTANGVTGGSGTASDPYIIEGWEIDAPTVNGIQILDTNAHFTIRACYIHDCETGWGAICLFGCANGTVTGNTCSNSDCGIYLDLSASNIPRNNTLSNNHCSNNNLGIWLSNARHNTLSDNNCSNNLLGIILGSSSSNAISGNNCSMNPACGMNLYLSNDNTLGGNNCSGNGSGINLDSSGSNTLRNNTFSSNIDGIYLYSSGGNTLSGNNCSGNDYGVYLSSSGNNTLSDNNCSLNSVRGIFLHCSDNNTLSGNNCSLNDGDGIRLESSDNSSLSFNNCSSNHHGVALVSSTNNTLSGNKVYSNGEFGIHLSDCHGTTVYHNIFFDNTEDHAYDDGGNENLWNASYPLGGNYWDNYTGVDEHSGPDQDQPGPDGIGDTPYEIDADSYDYYPLMAPSVTAPTASFTVSPATGYVSTVFFVDASLSFDAEDDFSELEVRWDWESDGVWDKSWSVVKTDTHQYSVEGTHTITLEVRDTLGLVNNTTRQVSVVPDDVPPVADAGPDQTVDAGTLVTFDGSGSSDNIGIINYTWTFVEGIEKEMYGVSPTYTFGDPGGYTIILDVVDAADNHDTDTVVITVLEVNDPPVADAGPDQTVAVGEEVTFDGSDSSDDVGIENYTWTFAYDDEERELYGVGPEFTFDITGTYIVTLTVEDAEGETDTDTMEITVEEEEEEQDEDGKSFLESYGLPLGIIVALALIALVMFFVLRGRKDGKAPTGFEELPATEAKGHD